MKQGGEMVVSAAPAEMMVPVKNDVKSYLRLPYARVLIPEPEGGFFAEILEFPGCIAEGETPDEAFQNVESIAESWIESCLEQGQDIPPPSANHAYSGKIALRLPRDLHRLATYKAQRDGVSINQVLVTAIAAWVGADNLFERIAHKTEMNVIQNFYSVRVVSTATPFVMSNAVVGSGSLMGSMYDAIGRTGLIVAGGTYVSNLACSACGGISAIGVGAFPAISYTPHEKISEAAIPSITHTTHAAIGQTQTKR